MFLLACDKFVLEMYLEQTGLRNSANRALIVNIEKTQSLEKQEMKDVFLEMK